MDALTLEAARLAENSNVQYCNFTLRPLSYEIYKRDGGELSWVICLVSYTFSGFN